MRGVIAALGLLGALAGCAHRPPPGPAPAPPPPPTAAAPGDPCNAPCLAPAQARAEADPPGALAYLQACLPCPGTPAAAFALAADQAPTPEARLVSLRAAVRQHPDAPLLWQLLGRAALAAGHAEEGLAALDRAKGLRPDDPLLAAELSHAEAAHGGAEARAQAKIAPLVEEAAARFDAGDPKGALDALGAALKATGRAPVARAGVEHRIALVHLSLGALPKAQAHLQAGLDVAPTTDPIRAALLVSHAELRLAEGRPGDALISASAAAELSPNDPLAHANVAEARARLKQPEEAMKALTRAVQAGLPRRLTRAALESLTGLRSLAARPDYRALVARGWGS